MRIVITGASCFIGKYLVERLRNEHDLIAVVRPKSRNTDEFRLKFPTVYTIELDMQEYNKLSSLIEGHVDAFIGLAWNGTRGEARLDEQMQKANYEASIITLGEAVKLGVETFITAGSQAEYGVQHGVVDEGYKEQPVTAYGKEKLRFYRDALLVCQKNHVRLIEPRFFSLYGVGDYDKSLIMSTIQKMKRNLSCDFTDCEQMWNFMNVRDAVEAIKFLLENKTIMSGVYNFAGEDTRKLKEYIFEIRDILDSKSELNFGVIPHNDSGRDGIQPDATKLLSTGWRPKVSFAQGIHEILVGI